MKILAIETSCDETAVAVVSDHNAQEANWICSSLVASQEDLHNYFGGVVPELASRRHIEILPGLVSEALSRAQVELRDLDGIAVTRCPGLMGALLVGLSYAKALAFTAGLPLVGVNHLAGHLAAILLESGTRPPWPHLGLIVSGGHTHLYHGQKPGAYELLGSTLDDAAGEAFDKVAKLMNLGYPGGRVIEQQAENFLQRPQMQAPDLLLPSPRLKKGPFSFSFSGIKTAVAQYLHKNPHYDCQAVCYVFQEKVLEILVQRLEKAIDEFRPRGVIFCGGVAANKRLRRGLSELCERKGIDMRIPAISWCTDNAAMIGAAGIWKLKAGFKDDFDLAPDPMASLDPSSLSAEFFPGVNFAKKNPTH